MNGVHCVISLIDAILIKYGGIRSVEEDHLIAVRLLNSTVGQIIKNVAQKSQTAKRIIAKKNLIEYENRDFIRSEALDMIRQVERFYTWATEHL